MAGALEIIVPVENDALVFTDPQRDSIRAFLKLFANKTVTFRLSKPTKPRSNSQNSYYWGIVLTTLADSTGHSTEELHIAVKDMFLPRKFLKLGNREVEIRKTTTDLNTHEFTQYLEQIRAWASTELGITIPTSEGTRP